MPLEGYSEGTFRHAGVERPVFYRGEGPGVVVMHELPGITPEVAEFGRRVSQRGLRTVLPCLFGTPGRPLGVGYLLQQFARVCISREFRLLAKRKSSPVTDWLRALCRQVHADCGGPGVGAVGMCLTGGFALALMLEESVLAPVLSQPSLPLPVTAVHRRALGISDGELEAAKRRASAERPVLGLRFTHDRMCPQERFCTLREELGEAFEAIEIDSSPGNPHQIKQAAHMVLTGDLDLRPGHPTAAALERVLEHLQQQLRPSAD